MEMDSGDTPTTHVIAGIEAWNTGSDLLSYKSSTEVAADGLRSHRTGRAGCRANPRLTSLWDGVAGIDLLAPAAAYYV
jgi:hypothetical protein